MPRAADEVQADFGLDLHADGAFIAANFKTAMTRRRTQPSSIHG